MRALHQAGWRVGGAWKSIERLCQRSPGGGEGERERTRNETGISLSSSLPLPGLYRLEPATAVLLLEGERETQRNRSPDWSKRARARSFRMHTSTMLASGRAGGQADVNDPPPKKDELSLGAYPNPTRTFAHFRGRRGARVWLRARRLWGSVALENGSRITLLPLAPTRSRFCQQRCCGAGKGHRDGQSALGRFLKEMLRENLKAILAKTEIRRP